MSKKRTLSDMNADDEQSGSDNDEPNPHKRQKIEEDDRVSLTDLSGVMKQKQWEWIELLKKLLIDQFPVHIIKELATFYQPAFQIDVKMSFEEYASFKEGRTFYTYCKKLGRSEIPRSEWDEIDLMLYGIPNFDLCRFEINYFHFYRGYDDRIVDVMKTAFFPNCVYLRSWPTTHISKEDDDTQYLLSVFGEICGVILKGRASLKEFLNLEYCCSYGGKYTFRYDSGITMFSFYFDSESG